MAAWTFSHLGGWVLRGAFEKNKPRSASNYEASACTTLANFLLARASHMAKRLPASRLLISH